MHTGNIAPHILRGLQLKQLGRFADAATAFKEALAQEPNDAFALHQLAACQWRISGAAQGGVADHQPGHRHRAKRRGTSRAARLHPLRTGSAQGGPRIHPHGTRPGAQRFLRAHRGGAGLVANGKLAARRAFRAAGARPRCRQLRCGQPARPGAAPAKQAGRERRAPRRHARPRSRGRLHPCQCRLGRVAARCPPRGRGALPRGAAAEPGFRLCARGPADQLPRPLAALPRISADTALPWRA